MSKKRGVLIILGYWMHRYSDGFLTRRTTTKSMKLPVTVFQQIIRVSREVLKGRIEVDAWSSAFGSYPHNAPAEDKRKAAEDLLASLGHLPKAEDLGFFLGLRIPATAYGEIGMGFRVAPTLRDSVKLVADFHHLIVPLVHYSYQDRGDGGQFEIGFKRVVHGRSEAVLVAAAVSMLCREIRTYGVLGIGIQRLELTASSKGMEARYQKHLRITPASTDALRNVVVLEKSVLSCVNPSADLDTFLRIRANAQAQAALDGEKSRLPIRIRERLLARIQDPPDMDELAGSIGMNKRQLRQALAKEGVSYQTLLRDCRVEHARTLLQNSALTIVQVAHRLGYADPAVFSHAFTRWTGKSPSTYRNELFKRANSSAG